MSPLLISLLALALTSPLLWIIRPYRFRHIGWLAALPPAAVAYWLLTQMPAIAGGAVISMQLPWAPQLGLELTLRLDGLAHFFGLIITVVGALIALYTGYYFEDEPRQGYFYGLLFLFMASMLGLVWADNLLTLFAFWEGTSITSYLLIAFKDSDKAAQEGARRAFLVTALGGLAMLLGMILLGTSAGTYSISELLATPGLTETPVAPAAIILILLGAFTKSAQFPFHFWLPGAMSAPTPASAYLHSATMVKAGIYLLARLHPALSEHPIWFWGLLITGAITMVLGAVIALGQYDIKALLAYATVSQLGVFVMLLAFRDEAAYVALIVGILAHAIYKGTLFMVAGIVDHATGTRDLRHLANLLRSMPLLTVVALLAGLSMAGIIPLFGFVAKELLLEHLIHASESMAGIGWAITVMAIIAAAFSAASAFTLLWEAFLRTRDDEGQTSPLEHPPSPLFVLPPLLLVLIGLAIPFLLYQVEGGLFAPAISSVAATSTETHLAIWHGFTLTFALSLVTLLISALLFGARAPIRRFWSQWPTGWKGASVWESGLSYLYIVATWVTRHVQGITLLQQARGILISAIVVLIYALTALRWPEDFPINWSALPHAAEVIMAFLAIFAAFITIRAHNRLSAIISLGVVGIAITLFFAFNSAPDLAITQLLVDILTVVLLVLVFYRIPPREFVTHPVKLGVRNLVISSFVGVLAFFFVLFSVGNPFFSSMGNYFLLNSVDLAHGGNVVNVILVDFRAFDTYGEITVLGIAAVGGYAVVRATLFRARPPEQVAENSTGQAPDSQQVSAPVKEAEG